MEFVVVGVNHKTAPVELRDRLAIGADALPTVLQRLLGEPGAQGLAEALVVSTCNRIEIYGIARELGTAVDAVFELFREHAGEASNLSATCYTHSGRDAVEHVFRVAAGADSMVLGEPEILGQLKSAYRRAVELQACGAKLGKLLESAFRVGKRARAETDVGRGTASLARAGLRLCRERFGSVRERAGLFIGAGYTAAQAIEVFHEAGARITIANRTIERAVELAGRYGGRAVGLDAIADELASADFMVSAIRTVHPSLHAAALRPLLGQRSQPLVMLDLGAPRNVDPEVVGAPGGLLFSAAELHGHIEADIQHRRDSLPHVEGIIREEARRFFGLTSSSQVVPAVRAVRDNADRVRRESLDALGKVSPEERDVLERFSHAFMNKLLHTPTVRLRECDPQTLTGRTRIEWTFSLFGIPSATHEPHAEEGTPPLPSPHLPKERPHS